MATSAFFSPDSDVSRAPFSATRALLSAATMIASRPARSIVFFLGLLSLARADSLGQLTVCIVEAYNLENLDASEPFGGTASDP